MILGFEPSAASDDRVARLQSLWTDWVDGLLSLPINLPGFSKAWPLWMTHARTWAASKTVSAHSKVCLSSSSLAGRAKQCRYSLRHLSVGWPAGQAQVSHRINKGSAFAFSPWREAVQAMSVLHRSG